VGAYTTLCDFTIGPFDVDVGIELSGEALIRLVDTDYVFSDPDWGELSLWKDSTNLKAAKIVFSTNEIPLTDSSRGEGRGTVFFNTTLAAGESATFALKARSSTPDIADDADAYDATLRAAVIKR
jgi:hypothetical protein